MSRSLPAVAPARVIHYVDVAPQPEAAQVLLYQAHELAERRRTDRVLYARWLARQAHIAERDRKVRRFWLGFGAVAGLAVCALVLLAGWLVYHAILGAALGLAGAGLAVLLLAGLVAGGHKCITIVQHWH